MYESSSLPPKYIIGEAKYGSSQLSKTKTGKQMSDEWVDSRNRLDNALGREKADEIRMELLLNPENIESVLVKVGKDGEVSQLILDEFGKKRNKKRGCTMRDTIKNNNYFKGYLEYEFARIEKFEIAVNKVISAKGDKDTDK